MGFVADKVGLWQIIVQGRRFSTASIIPSILHTHLGLGAGTTGPSEASIRMNFASPSSCNYKTHEGEFHPVFKHHAVKTSGREHVQLHTFITSALDGNGWLDSRPDRFIHREEPPEPTG
jgi:hypothetical protein